MTKAVATVRDGHTFQARQFWLKALAVLNTDGPLAKVGFEGGPKGYDDIWVEYKPGRGPSASAAGQLQKQHFQCKWHVSTGDYGSADLVNPDFINATSFSLLQRARAAQQGHAAGGNGVQFSFLTNWHVKTEDSLAKLIHQRDGRIRLDRLFDGTTARAEMGKLRDDWCDHLQVDEAQLRRLAPTLAFSTFSQPLTDLREALEHRLPLYGLRVEPLQQDSCWYDDLIYQWLAAGRIEFDQRSLKEALDQQGLFERPAQPKTFFGVKSFEHPIDCLENRCEKVLNLTPLFKERQIRAEGDWQQEIYPRLKEFLIEAAQKAAPIGLALDAHATLAFAAGTVLNIKAGRAIEVEQRILDRTTWHALDCEHVAGWPGWRFGSAHAVPGNQDLVVAVSVTHDVAPAVRAYADAHLPGCAILEAVLESGPGNTMVKTGRHAFELAEALVQEITRIRQRPGRVHLFIAGPNAFTFFVGQRQALMGAVTLYEYDFEGQAGGGYSSSLVLPIQAPAEAD